LGQAIESSGQHRDELKAKKRLSAGDDDPCFGKQLFDFGSKRGFRRVHDLVLRCQPNQIFQTEPSYGGQDAKAEATD
jgi:hypothetical protein